MGPPEPGLHLFNMDFFSSVTAMVLIVNLITQVIKEVFLTENVDQRIPKLITLLASVLVVGVSHYIQWVNNPYMFNHSNVELVFLIFVNSILITALSMGNYKVLNLTKERKLTFMKEQAQANGNMVQAAEEKTKEKEELSRRLK